MLSTLFFFLVAFLLILAVLDLFVGVSNDAVNFLNSAVGCKIAPMKHILIVASAGVLIGSTFSSGMMDVARSGMFHPELFSFRELAYIYFSVMIADVLMLKVFNYLGLPTSTTVSIIFELLGSAVFASGFSLLSSGHSISEVISYIKPDKTATIVSAILISVVVSFIAGALVQFICRVLFSFRLSFSYRIFGGVYSGFCISAILYFLVMKGAKGSTFMTPQILEFIQNNTLKILLISFAFVTIICQILIYAGYNVFKLIILSGTFALAFAFAGNDLVNFVGVPFATMEGYKEYISSGLSPDTVMMDVLNESSRTSSYLLLFSGLVMVVTFFISRSALNVIRTSINLSSSSRGNKEQFGASAVGRVVTRVGLSVSKTIVQFMPGVIKRTVAKRYEPNKDSPVNSSPFDYVRASVNLVVSAILISCATSLKLPLSTTYVTFMVAMGASFADGAWDRESSVYRISGVFSVIAGWFMTGICAFTFAFAVSFCVFIFKWFAIFFLMAVVLYVMLKNIISREDDKKDEKNIGADACSMDIISAISKATPAYCEKNSTFLRKAMDAFFSDEELKLKKIRNKSLKLVDKITENRALYFSFVLDENSKAGSEAKHFYYLAYTNMIEATRSVQQCISHCYNHIANRHTIFGASLARGLYSVLLDVEHLSVSFRTVSLSCNSDEIIHLSEEINAKISNAQISLVDVISKNEISISASEVYLDLLQTMRDLVNRCVLVMLQKHALLSCIEGGMVDSSDQKNSAGRLLDSVYIQNQ